MLQILRLQIFLAVAFSLMLASCGKVYDLNGFDWEPDVPPSDSVFNREVQILDMGDSNLPAGHIPVEALDPLFFSLEKFSSVNVGYKSTERWDIAFAGLSRSEISSNNGSREGFGYGTAAIGGIMVIDSAYSQVTNIPDDSQFVVPGNIGLAGFGETKIPGGHAFYTFFSNIFRPDKMDNLTSSDPEAAADANRYLHMIYCLSEDFAKAFPGEYGEQHYKPTPRTIILRTAAGNYAKMETQSLYKGVMDPKLMYRGTDRPVPYYSFRYLLVKSSEKRFGFVARRKKLTVNMTKHSIEASK